MKNVASVIDHTLLMPDATSEQIKTLCAEAMDYGFASVCVSPCRVRLCASLLAGSGVMVCTVVGFPSGAATPACKAFEAAEAVRNGADEVDMVLNIGALKDREYDLVEADIRGVVEACGGKTVKVILETCLLTDEEKVRACLLARKAGAHFVKTSTGFSSGGATREDVRLLRATVGDTMRIKASGGIRSYQAAIAMLDAGADRLGCSSSISIVKTEEDYA